MTDKEIIKALECCISENKRCNCKNCPYKNVLGYCFDKLNRDAIDLINRQQSAIDVYMQENDRLKTAYIQVSEDRNEIRKETEAEIEAWKKINQRLYDEMEERRKEDIGIAKGYARIETIKELEAKIHEKLHEAEMHGNFEPVVTCEMFDSVVKELVGEGNG
jgi:polyribonucleotide nucleotidyltransferase